MITAALIMLTSAIISFALASFTAHLIRHRDKVVQDEPFEIPKISITTPTPTPVYEKKKRGRKPKTTK